MEAPGGLTMATRKRNPKREAQLGFESLSIEGGLLSPEWLSKVAQLAGGAQAEPDYRIPKGLNLRDEIGRYWRIAQAHWSEFAAGQAGNADPRLVAERFVQGLLSQSFGFVAITQTEPIVIDERSSARRLAGHVARLQPNGTPSAAEYRHALRQVIGRCVYGVDLNPMAVELCKVSLWMDAVEPGLPLTFLNSHIQHGNALLGTTPELMGKGIPDAAWEPIEGDDKKTASALKKKNKISDKVEYDLFASRPRGDDEVQAVARAVATLEAAGDANPDALAIKEATWDGILGSNDYRHQKFVADAWCAAFVWPKQPGELFDAAPTSELWRQLRDGQGKPLSLTVRTVENLSGLHHFFHWHLAFPQVFARGGFDIVIGNPPWIAHARRASQPLPPGVRGF